MAAAAGYGQAARGYRSAATPGPRGVRNWSMTIDQLVKLHADLVRRIARRYGRATGAAVDVDDLVSVGVIGLIDAYRAYNPEGGRPFRVYAEYRVRGAILDELRRLDPLSQPMRRKARMLRNAQVALSHELGRDPDEEELADYLEIPLEELQKRRRETNCQFVAVESSGIDDVRANLALASKYGPPLKLMLKEALDDLPERDQQILSLYYFHDLSLKEIGMVLDLTEARICQLHKAAVQKIRAHLEMEGVF